jgi:hypothetical protein
VFPGTQLGTCEAMGGIEVRHEPGDDRASARFVLLCIAIAVACVLAGFAVGIARSHAEQSHPPVTVETTVSIPSGT